MRIPESLRSPRVERSLVNDLPPEVLAYIFELGTREDEDPDSDTLSDGWETEDEDMEPSAVKDVEDDVEMVDEDKIPEEEPRHPFQVSVSNVCSFWRQTALSTPVLWTRINLQPPYDLNVLYLERSAGAPLDITLDTDIESGSTDDEERNQDAEPPSHQMTMEQFLRALELILPHASRWRTLELLVSEFAFMYEALKRLNDLPDAPLLEVLQLYHHEEQVNEDLDVFSPPELREPFFLPFSGNAPKLGGLALWGAHIDWARALPLFRSLVDLEFAWHSRDVRPDFRQFAALLREAPRLQTLTICYSGPAGDSPADWLESFTEEEIHGASGDAEGEGMQSVMALALPELQSLSMSYLEADYATHLIKTFAAPKLARMMLDLENEDFSTFAQALVSTNLLNCVEDLKLRSMPCDVGCIVALLRRLKQLRKLSLNFHYCDPSWFNLLSNVPGTSHPVECEDAEFRLPSPPRAVWTDAAAADAEASRDRPERDVFLPSLEAFSASALSGTQIRWFVQRRIDLGVPLKAVWLDDDEDVSDEDEAWLRSHLEVFEYYEEEDDETDDAGEDLLLEILTEDEDEDEDEDDS